MALISDLPNATPQKSDLMEIQNGQTSSNNSSVGQLMQLSASENLAPAYDANAGVYAVGDFVSYDGTLYQCNTAIATPEAFDATKWDAVKVTEITSGASVIQLTQAEYTALSTAEKMNGSIYKITDNAKMYCLDKAYHPVEECTVAEYSQKTPAQQNDGTIYIKTDAETTGEDIQVSSTDTRTIDEGIADADGQVIDYATWSAMTPQEQAAAGKVYVPDFPTATPNATEIPMSSSDNASVADKIEELGNNITTQTVDGVTWTIKRNGKFYEMWADISIDASAVEPIQWGSSWIYRDSQYPYSLPVTLDKKICDLSFTSGPASTMPVYYTDASGQGTGQENRQTVADILRPTQTTSTIVVHKYIRGYVN